MVSVQVTYYIVLRVNFLGSFSPLIVILLVCRTFIFCFPHMLPNRWYVLGGEEKDGLHKLLLLGGEEKDMVLEKEEHHQWRS